jgi:hypothetical protein
MSAAEVLKFGADTFGCVLQLFVKYYSRRSITKVMNSPHMMERLIMPNGGRIPQQSSPSATSKTAEGRL